MSCGFIYPIKTGEFHIVELHSVRGGKENRQSPVLLRQYASRGCSGFRFLRHRFGVAESYVVARVEECEIRSHGDDRFRAAFLLCLPPLPKRREAHARHHDSCVCACLLFHWHILASIICLIAVKQGNLSGRRGNRQTLCLLHFRFRRIRDIGHKLFCGVSDFFALFLILGTVIRNEYDILCTAKQGVISFCVAVDIQLRRFLPTFRERGARRIHLFGAEDLKLITVGVRPYLE